ncbi:ROK family transcriptional regulator [Actinomycetaceae bacterium L2_0104]
MGPQHLRRMGRAHPTEARAHNRSVVLQHLFQSGPESRAELARTTGLTRVTMSALVEDLLNEGLVTELGTEDRPGKVGKRATLVGLSENTWQIAAVNLTNDGSLSGAVLTLGGRVVHRLDKKSILPQGEAGIDALTEFCHRVADAADCQILGLGVSSPGVIKPDGLIEQAPNRGWYDVPLAQLLEERLSFPVLVANDANCAALAEYTFGGAQGDGLLRIVIGHGVGAGLVMSGALMNGSEDAAGEIGHVTVMDERDSADSPLGEPTRCACGRTGCLETILSEPALRRMTKDLTPEERSVRLEAIGGRLGNVLSPIVATLNIAEIIVSGPSQFLEGPLLAATDAVIRERTLPRSHRTLRVRPTTLGSDGALQGAAVLVLAGRLGIA